MNKVIVLLLGLSACSLSFVTNSAPMGEDTGICYVFKANKLVKKSTCIVSYGYGAGGHYQSIDLGGVEYNTETTTCYDSKKDEQYDCGTTLNDMDAEYYNRDLFYNKISDPSLVDDRSLGCYKTKNNKIDICVK